MATIIDRSGQLWKRTLLTDSNSDESDEYELLDYPNIPTLQYPIKIDIRVAITDDGRLYDTHRLTYITSESFKFIQVLPLLTDSSYCIALTNGGHLCRIFAGNGSSEVRFITDNVELISSTSSEFIVKTKYGGWNILHDIDIDIYVEDVNRTVISHPLDISNIIYNSGRLIVTNDEIYHPDISLPNVTNITVRYNTIPHKSDLTMVGIISNITDNIPGVTIMAIDIMGDHFECHTYTINDIATRRVRITNINEVLGDEDWIGFIELGTEFVLLSRTGETYYVEVQGDKMGLTRTKIPYHILESKTRIKNSMSDLRYSE